MRRLAAFLVALLASGSLALPAFGQAGVQLKSIQISPAQAGPSDNVMGTATLTGPAPAGGAYVQLSGSDTVWIPGTVVVPEGMASSVFVVSVNSRPTNGEAVVVGTYNGRSVGSNPLLTLADPKAAARAAQQAADAAAAAQAAASSSYYDPYGWGYGYYGYPGYPNAGPYIRGNTYTPVTSTPTIGNYSGMGGIPSGPAVMDFGNNVPRAGGFRR